MLSEPQPTPHLGFLPQSSTTGRWGHFAPQREQLKIAASGGGGRDTSMGHVPESSPGSDVLFPWGSGAPESRELMLAGPSISTAGGSPGRSGLQLLQNLHVLPKQLCLRLSSQRGLQITPEK